MNSNELVVVAPVADSADTPAEHRSFSRGGVSDLVKAVVAYVVTYGALLALVLPQGEAALRDV